MSCHFLLLVCVVVVKISSDFSITNPNASRTNYYDEWNDIWLAAVYDSRMSNVYPKMCRKWVGWNGRANDRDNDTVNVLFCTVNVLNIDNVPMWTWERIVGKIVTKMRGIAFILENIFTIVWDKIYVITIHIKYIWNI